MDIYLWVNNGRFSLSQLSYILYFALIEPKQKKKNKKVLPSFCSEQFHTDLKFALRVASRKKTLILSCFEMEHQT